MRNPEARDLAEHLLRTPGVLSRAEILNRWSPAALRAALRSRRVTAVVPGVFGATLHAESLVTRAHAAAVWCGSDAVVTGTTALHAWGLLDNPPQIVRVTAPWGLKRSCPPWLTIARTNLTSPSAQWFACPVATPAWAIVRGFGDLSPAVARDVVYRAVREREVSVEQLRDVLAREPLVRGRKALVRVVDACAAGSESHLETLGLRNVFNTQEFSQLVRQHEIRVAQRQFRLDMFDHETLTAIELDGAGGHGASDRRQHDVTRDALLAEIGILTLRFTYRDVVERGEWVRATVRGVLEQRRIGRRGAA